MPVRARENLPMTYPVRFLGRSKLQNGPGFIGAPEEIRTPDPQIRSLVLTVAQAGIDLRTLFEEL
jgi:hypothetical protein